MSHCFIKGAKGLFASGSIPYVSGTQKAQLVTLDGTLEDTYVKAITGATNASPIVLTHSDTGTAWAVNSIVLVRGVVGNTVANGTYRIKASTTTTTTLETLDGHDTVGNGAYVSGGCLVNLSAVSYLDGWNACVSAGTAVTLGSKTVTDGVLDCADLTFSAVPAGTYHGVIYYYDTTDAATSPVWFFEDGRQRVTVAADAALSATTVWVSRLEGPIVSGTTLLFSNGVSATLSANAAAGATSLTVTALSAAITAGHQADAPWTNSLLPITTGSSGSISVTIDDGTAYVGAPAGLGEI